MENLNCDVVIVGCGVSGCFAALHLSEKYKVIMLSKESFEESDSYLAQGGICVLRNEGDYDSFYRDTMKAGHNENRAESVDIMIKSSREVINELVDYGVRFERNEDGSFKYTREGAHEFARILFHEDITGKEITSHLLEAVKKKENVTLMEYTTMLDIIEKDNTCYGIACKSKDGELFSIQASYTLLATGGVGGLYPHSTNFPCLTADSVAIALEHGIEVENVDYVQIHPTTLYTKEPGRSFLISESVRGEGAKLRGADGERFANEVLPRDLMTAEIHKQMEKDNKPYVWLDMTVLGEEMIKGHFPNIYQRCLEEGYDAIHEWIPVVPAQHYFMGGVYVNRNSKTTMDRLYAAGETSCNGVHGRNRLASNSLLESLVFAKRAALEINTLPLHEEESFASLWNDKKAELEKTQDNLAETYKDLVWKEIKRSR